MTIRSRLREGVSGRGWLVCRLWACRGGVGVALVVVGVFYTLTRTYTDYLLRSLEGPIEEDNPELLRYIRAELLKPPSSEPYNLLGKKNIASREPEKSEMFYNETLRTLFNGKRGGFFVEAGALDGETMSNTLWLEQEAAWEGLLVEADHIAFLELVSKHRRAWVANVCLAPNPYPSKEMFSILPHFPGPMAWGLGFKTRAMHGLTRFSSNKAIGNSWFQKVQCVPLESLLLAMGVTRVDLLVLDVEGAELAILGHFDLQKFDVQVVCVEWKKADELDEVSRQLSERGYQEAARDFEDLILIKKGSEFQGRLPKNRRR
ncbi:protein Star-like [Cherax quadricarinatus]|uniref:protein Star-like n=1 Tax=Cherax quadricarinatus TaxID=27406 RepID=UPI002379CD78|nr:uncharacterized protein LOC128694790 [Cherax quadricarinatus]